MLELILLNICELIRLLAANLPALLHKALALFECSPPSATIPATAVVSTVDKTDSAETIDWLKRQLFSNQKLLQATRDEYDATVGHLNDHIFLLDARIVSLEAQVKCKDDLLADLPQKRRSQRAEAALAASKLANATLKDEIFATKSAHKSSDIARLELVGHFNDLLKERDDALAKAQSFCNQFLELQDWVARHRCQPSSSTLLAIPTDFSHLPMAPPQMAQNPYISPPASVSFVDAPIYPLLVSAQASSWTPSLSVDLITPVLPTSLAPTVPNLSESTVDAPAPTSPPPVIVDSVPVESITSLDPAHPSVVSSHNTSSSPETVAAATPPVDEPSTLPVPDSSLPISPRRDTAPLSPQQDLNLLCAALSQANVTDEDAAVPSPRTSVELAPAEPGFQSIGAALDSTWGVSASASSWSSTPSSSTPTQPKATAKSKAMEKLRGKGKGKAVARKIPAALANKLEASVKRAVRGPAPVEKQIQPSVTPNPDHMEAENADGLVLTRPPSPIRTSAARFQLKETEETEKKKEKKVWNKNDLKKKDVNKKKKK